MKMPVHRRLSSDNGGRIPFSYLAVMIFILSSYSSVYMANIDREFTQENELLILSMKNALDDAGIYASGIVVTALENFTTSGGYESVKKADIDKFNNTLKSMIYAKYPFNTSLYSINMNIRTVSLAYTYTNIIIPFPDGNNSEKPVKFDVPSGLEGILYADVVITSHDGRYHFEKDVHVDRKIEKPSIYNESRWQFFKAVLKSGWIEENMISELRELAIIGVITGKNNVGDIIDDNMVRDAWINSINTLVYYIFPEIANRYEITDAENNPHSYEPDAPIISDEFYSPGDALVREYYGNVVENNLSDNVAQALYGMTDELVLKYIDYIEKTVEDTGEFLTSMTKAMAEAIPFLNVTIIPDMALDIYGTNIEISHITAGEAISGIASTLGIVSDYADDIMTGIKNYIYIIVQNAISSFSKTLFPHTDTSTTYLQVNPYDNQSFINKFVNNFAMNEGNGSITIGSYDIDAIQKSAGNMVTENIAEELGNETDEEIKSIITSGWTNLSSYMYAEKWYTSLFEDNGRTDYDNITFFLEKMDTDEDIKNKTLPVIATYIEANFVKNLTSSTAAIPAYLDMSVFSRVNYDIIDYIINDIRNLFFSITMQFVNATMLDGSGDMGVLSTEKSDLGKNNDETVKSGTVNRGRDSDSISLHIGEISVKTQGVHRTSIVDITPVPYRTVWNISIVTDIEIPLKDITETNITCKSGISFSVSSAWSLGIDYTPTAGLLQDAKKLTDIVFDSIRDVILSYMSYIYDVAKVFGRAVEWAMRNVNRITEIVDNILSIMEEYFGNAVNDSMKFFIDYILPVIKDITNAGNGYFRYSLGDYDIIFTYVFSPFYYALYTNITNQKGYYCNMTTGRYTQMVDGAYRISINFHIPGKTVIDGTVEPLKEHGFFALIGGTNDNWSFQLTSPVETAMNVTFISLYSLTGMKIHLYIPEIGEVDIDFGIKVSYLSSNRNSLAEKVYAIIDDEFRKLLKGNKGIDDIPDEMIAIAKKIVYEAVIPYFEENVKIMLFLDVNLLDLGTDIVLEVAFSDVFMFAQFTEWLYSMLSIFISNFIGNMNYLISGETYLPKNYYPMSEELERSVFVIVEVKTKNMAKGRYYGAANANIRALKNFDKGWKVKTSAGYIKVKYPSSSLIVREKKVYDYVQIEFYDNGR